MALQVHCSIWFRETRASICNLHGHRSSIHRTLAQNNLLHIYSQRRAVGRDLIVYYCPEMCPIWGVFSLFYGRGIFRCFGQPGVVGRSVPQKCGARIVVSAYCTSFPLGYNEYIYIYIHRYIDMCTNTNRQIRWMDGWREKDGDIASVRGSICWTVLALALSILSILNVYTYIYM